MGAGRPRKWNDPEQLADLIQDYIDETTFNVPRVDKENKPVLNNKGDQIQDTYFSKPPTITGLCLHLGCSRETLNDYSHKKEYSDTIKKYKDLVENHLEEELHRNQGQVTGIIFNLKNNFGWKDKQEIDTTNVNIDVTQNLSDEALEKAIKEAEERLNG